MGIYEIKNFFTSHKSMDFDKCSPFNENARGVPALLSSEEDCGKCTACADRCPVKAISISKEGMQIDCGACIQCGICTDLCPEERLVNSGFTHVFAFRKEELKIRFQKGDFVPEKPEIPENVLIFQEMTEGKGICYREIAAAGNNAVECELNASFNNLFDSEGQGIRSVASPKHADVLLYSGPVSENMAGPLNTAWECMPEPKAMAAAGSEAVAGGLFELGRLPKEPDVFIGGDPPRPDVMIQAMRMLMGKFKYSFQSAFHKRIQELKNRRQQS